MIRVNLLRNKALNAGVKASTHDESILDDVQLDEGFSTFEYSQVGQLIKLLLIVGFVIPLVVFEKMRGDESNSLLNEKNLEVETMNELKYEKETELSKFNNLEGLRKTLDLRNEELKSVQSHRLTAVMSADAVQSALIEDVWLLNMKLDGDTIELSGQTLAETGLDRFVKNLNSIKNFKGVSVKKDVQVTTNSGRVVNEFLVTLTVVPNKSNKVKGES